VTANYSVIYVLATAEGVVQTGNNSTLTLFIAKVRIEF